jgi:phage terminase large subunit GpA-like protein
MKYGPALKALVLRFAAGWLPPVRVPLSQWADDHARLSSEASAQVGGWHSFPYQREPLDALSPHSAYESVVLMWAAQMGKTQLLLNLVSYMVAEDPGPALVVQPTLPMAEAFSKDRLSPLFRDTPVLQGLVAAAKSRDIGSTIFHRRFRDGHVSIVGANSPAGLASRPIRYLLMDELLPMGRFGRRGRRRRVPGDRANPHVRGHAQNRHDQFAHGEGCKPHRSGFPGK